MKQLALSLVGTRTARLDDFLIGGNTQVIEHLRGLSADPLRSAQNCPVTYLWGERGCGKTHLLAAVAQELQAVGAHVQWVPGEDRADSQAAGLPPVLVIIDNCDELDGMAQQRAFEAFVRAKSQGVPVLAAGRRPVIDLPLRDDLRSRLGWGLVFQLQPLSEAAGAEALTREAHRRGLVLGPEVCSYLMTRFARDLKSLMNLLDRLDHFSLVQQRALTIPMLKAMLDEEAA